MSRAIVPGRITLRKHAVHFGAVEQRHVLSDPVQQHFSLAHANSQQRSGLGVPQFVQVPNKNAWQVVFCKKKREHPLVLTNCHIRQQITATIGLANETRNLESFFKSFIDGVPVCVKILLISVLVFRCLKMLYRPCNSSCVPSVIINTLGKFINLTLRRMPCDSWKSKIRQCGF